MEWISVNEKMPEIGQYILIFNCDPDEGKIVCEALHLDNYFYLGRTNERGKFVTHWMPLPEPPKE